MGIAGQAADLVLAIEQQMAGDGSALSAGGADYEYAHRQGFHAAIRGMPRRSMVLCARV
jgi:hypothetical protein